MSKSTTVSVGAVLIAVLLLALIVLVVLWVVLLKRNSGKWRKLMFLTGIAAIILALLLFGGQWILEVFELTWRQWLRSVFALLIWSCGLTVSVLIVWRIPGAISRRGRLLQGIAALALVAAMGLGTLFGGFWLYRGEESVAQWNGEKIVMVEEHFLDYVCIYYEYHGPFVRGSKPIGPIGG